MVLTFLEAYDVTGDRAFLARAKAAHAFVLSGWDEAAGGGIWWHEGRKEGTKNTCSNASAAVSCLRLAAYLSPEEARAQLATAERIVRWTDRTFLDADGLYFDSRTVASGKMNRAKLTYNTALMIRAKLGLWRATGGDDWLAQAKRSATAAEWFADARTGAYRDAFKWAHLQVEADVEAYRATGDERLLRRAAANAEHEYAAFRERPPGEMIEAASVARTLWLMAGVQGGAGRDP